MIILVHKIMRPFKAVVFALVLLVSCVSSTRQSTFWPDSRNNPVEQPICISVDADFSQTEQDKIDQALKAWETASSNKVKFIVTWNVPKPGWYKDLVPLKPNQGIFLWNLPRTYFHLTDEQKKLADKLLGLTVYGPGENSAHVIVYTGLEEPMFYSVALHEIGHLIGLKHIRAKSVMSEHASSDCITDLDAIQLCELYDCKPKPNCN